jgi:hypothetical protein
VDDTTCWNATPRRELKAKIDSAFNSSPKKSKGGPSSVSCDAMATANKLGQWHCEACNTMDYGDGQACPKCNSKDIHPADRSCQAQEGHEKDQGWRALPGGDTVRHRDGR